MSKNTPQNLLLRPFTDDDFEGLLALNNLLYPDHLTSIESMRHKEKTRGVKIQHKHWVWAQDNVILCSALYTQWEEIYHPYKFVIKIYIHPDHQGQGYGTFCYDFLMKELEPLNPIKISAHVHEPHTHSIHFFENRGFKNTFKERESSLDLTVYNPKLYRDELDFVLQQGFRIVTLSEFRKEDDKADYKAWELERDVGPDMPWTDPITIPEFDVYKKQVIAHPKFNPDSWFFVLDGDRITGLNHLWKNEIDKGINTGLTGVRREYRRKGVASALKHTSLTWAKKQGYEWIRTDNAASNEGMLSINIRAGFKFIPAWLLFERFLKEEK